MHQSIQLVVNMRINRLLQTVSVPCSILNNPYYTQMSFRVRIMSKINQMYLVNVKRVIAWNRVLDIDTLLTQFEVQNADFFSHIWYHMNE